MVLRFRPFPSPPAPLLHSRAPTSEKHGGVLTDKLMRILSSPNKLGVLLALDGFRFRGPVEEGLDEADGLGDLDGQSGGERQVPPSEGEVGGPREETREV